VVEVPVVADPVEEPPDRPNYNQKMPGICIFRRIGSLLDK